MLRLKHWLKDFFGFSRSQVNGFIILLPLITIFIFSEPVWHWWVARRPVETGCDQVKLDSLIALWDAGKVENITRSGPRPTFFAFDPNIATPQNFIALGFPEKMISRITRYREKGGRFRKKSDLLKIYGFDSTFYQQISSFIILPSDDLPKKGWPKAIKKETRVTPKWEVEKFDLNKADTSRLKRINGIGEKLSLRILRYRDLLGGFVSLSQLKEVYGLDSVVVNRLSKSSYLEENFQPAMININAASEKQLAGHPYLSRAARSIVAYRFQHGEFKTLEDIRNIGTLDENTIKKIWPYLKVNED